MTINTPVNWAKIPIKAASTNKEGSAVFFGKLSNMDKMMDKMMDKVG